MIAPFQGPRHAFTLIEVLIAVIILALGLLGLGAVFPAVISQQRAGTEATMGVLAANSATTSFSGTDLTSRVSDLWSNWRAVEFDNNGLGIQQTTWYAQGGWNVPDYDASGAMIMGAGGAASQLSIPVAQRLYPNQVGAVPQFVWDAVVHRRPSFDPALPDRLEIAVFIRRLDARIRPPRRQNPPSTYQMVTRTAPASEDWRFPVAVDGNNNPTGDGQGVYARPIDAAVQFIYNDRDPLLAKRNRLYLPDGVEEWKWQRMRQKSQKLVDNLGHVFTVDGSGGGADTGPRYVEISPAMPRYVVSDDAAAPRAPGVVPARVVQVVFTPQIPASVELIEVNE